MNKQISKLGQQASTLVKTTKKQDINQRMLQLELKKSKEDFKKLKGTLDGVLERQRASDMHVESLEKSMRKISNHRSLSTNKNISGNLITVYNNAGLNEKEQYKSSGFYYS